MRWGMASTGYVRLRYTNKRNIPIRQVNTRSRRQRQPDRVQWTPALHLLRRYESRSNNRRRGWWCLACLHTEFDVGIFSLNLKLIPKTLEPLVEMPLAAPDWIDALHVESQRAARLGFVLHTPVQHLEE